MIRQELKNYKKLLLLGLLMVEQVHPRHQKLFVRKIQKKLGWKAKISLNLGLLQTFDWYLNNKVFFDRVSKKLYINRLGLKL